MYLTGATLTKHRSLPVTMDNLKQTMQQVLKVSLFRISACRAASLTSAQELARLEVENAELRQQIEILRQTEMENTALHEQVEDLRQKINAHKLRIDPSSKVVCGRRDPKAKVEFPSTMRFKGPEITKVWDDFVNRCRNLRK